MLGPCGACRGRSGRRTRTRGIRARVRLKARARIRAGARSETGTVPFALRRAIFGRHAPAGSRPRAIGLSVQVPLRPPRPVDTDVSRVQQVASIIFVGTDCTLGRSEPAAFDRNLALDSIAMHSAGEPAASCRRRSAAEAFRSGTGVRAFAREAAGCPLARRRQSTPCALWRFPRAAGGRDCARPQWLAAPSAPMPVSQRIRWAK
jgi:hypothetical protein